MARLASGPVLPSLAVALAAAALVGPSLFTAPRGEPLLVTAPDTLHPANLDDTECAAPLPLFEGEPAATGDSPDASLAALVLRSGNSEYLVPLGAHLTDGARLMLLIDASGRVVFSAKVPELAELHGEISGCLGSEAVPGSI